MQIGSPSPSTLALVKRDNELWKASQLIEANFLAEMLKAAGFGDVPDSFGGGPGEEQFSSFLVDAQSKAMVQTRGVGIAEAVYRSLLKSEVR